MVGIVRFFFNKWVIAFLLLPYVLMDFFYMNNAINVFLFFRSIPGLIGLVIFMAKFGDYKDSVVFLFALFCYIIAIGISGLVNSNLTFGTMINCLSLFGLCLYIIGCMDRFYDLIKGLYILFTTIMIITLVLAILFPSTVFSYDYSGQKVLIGIFGNKNTVQLFFIPAACFSLILANFRTNKAKLIPVLLSLILLVFVIMSKSGTGIIAASVMILFLLIYRWVKLPPLFMFCVYIAIFIGIIFGNWQSSELGSNILLLINKDPTFTHRTIIWNIVFDYINDSWVFGYGVKNDIILNNFPVLYDSANAISAAHNGFLEVLLTSGVFGLVCFITILFNCFIRLQKNKKDRISVLLTYSISSFLIIALMESVLYFDRPFFWIMLLMAVNINRIISQSKQSNELTNKSSLQSIGHTTFYEHSPLEA